MNGSLGLGSTGAGSTGGGSGNKVAVSVSLGVGGVNPLDVVGVGAAVALTDGGGVGESVTGELAPGELTLDELAPGELTLDVEGSGVNEAGVISVL